MAADELDNRVRQALKRLERMMATFQDLVREVEETAGVVQSAIVFIGGLKAEIQALKDAGADPAKLDELVGKLDANERVLAEAIANNPPPPPPGE
jgi:hypothetical protein